MRRQSYQKIISDLSLYHAHIRQSIPIWQALLIKDKKRNEFYKKIIQKNVKGKIVLEIGTGGGLLAVLAAQAGAKHVYTCELNPILAFDALRLFRRLKLENKITLIPKNSLNIKTNDIPSVDFILHEIFGSDPLSEGVYSSLKDGQRFLKPGGTFLPEAFCLNFQNVRVTPEPLKPLKFSGVDFKELEERLAQIPVNQQFFNELKSLEIGKPLKSPMIRIHDFIQTKAEHLSMSVPHPVAKKATHIATTFTLVHQDIAYQVAPLASEKNKFSSWNPVLYRKESSDRIDIGVLGEKKFWVR